MLRFVAGLLFLTITAAQDVSSSCPAPSTTVTATVTLAPSTATVTTTIAPTGTTSGSASSNSGSSTPSESSSHSRTYSCPTDTVYITVTAAPTTTTTIIGHPGPSSASTTTTATLSVPSTSSSSSSLSSSSSTSSTSSSTALTCSNTPKPYPSLSVACGSSQSFLLQACSTYDRANGKYLFFDPASHIPGPNIDTTLNAQSNPPSFSNNINNASVFRLGSDCTLRSDGSTGGNNSVAVRYQSSLPGTSWLYFYSDATVAGGGYSVPTCSITGGGLTCTLNSANVFSTWSGTVVDPPNLLLFGPAPSNYSAISLGYQIYLSAIPTVVPTCPRDNLTTYKDTRGSAYQIRCNQDLPGNDIATATRSTGFADCIEQAKNVPNCGAVTYVPSRDLSCYFKPINARNFVTQAFECDSAVLPLSASNKRKARRGIAGGSSAVSSLGDSVSF